MIKKIFVLTCLITNLTYADSENININFKNLKIKDLIKITSKVMDKNILMTSEIKGNVDFISNSPVYKKDLMDILIYVLESKGYTLTQNGTILRITKVNAAAKTDSSVHNSKKNKQYDQMATHTFIIKYSNVDYIASKIKHLISKSADIVIDKKSNSLILTDFTENIKTIKKVVSIIEKDNKKVVEIVKLKNIQASVVLDELTNVSKNVFNQNIEKEKVSIVANKDINFILFVGKKENVDFLIKYLNDIDKKESLVERVVEVIGLKNIESRNIIKVVDSIIDKRKYINENDKPFASMDNESNSIILMGPKIEVTYLKELVKKLDIDRSQVYVQAKIIEVSNNRAKEVGIKYGLKAGTSGSDGVFVLSTSLAQNAVSAKTVLNELDSIIDLSTPTINSGLALSATLNLLKNNKAIDIISEPSILAINNKESSIYVGETKSFQTGTTTTDSGTINETFKRENIGLSLKVKPRISSQNRVTLEIETVIEDASNTKTGINPDTTKKEVKTTAIVNNGESVILGGLIKNKMINSEDKIPFLGDLPILGMLFRNRRDETDKINLVVIITPYIIPKSKDLTYIRNQLAELKTLEDKYTNNVESILLKRKLELEKSDNIKKQNLYNKTKEEQEIVDEFSI